MTTYRIIQNWVKNNHGFVPKTCWIAHVKAQHGLILGLAPNRHDKSNRTNPCPPDKTGAIIEALRQFGDLPR